MNLIGLTTAELEDALVALGEPKFRGRQLAEWMYRRGATSFDNMTNLSRELRTRLAATHSLDLPTIANAYHSHDDSTKLLLQMHDGERIETVHLPYPDRLSVCISSQAGCAMACAFCATGLGGFRRNLTVGEIIAQPLLSLRIADCGLRSNSDTSEGAPALSLHSAIRNPQSAIEGSAFRIPHSALERLTHIVFMGMGEPLLNYDNVLKAVRLLHEEMGVPMRHITISTVGILRGMERLAGEKLQLTLAVSLHAPDDALRHRLIPTSTKTRVTEIVQAARDYVAKTGRRVTFEYVVLGGVNDTPELARKLANLCQGWPCHVNLIPWNAVPGATFDGTGFVTPAPDALRRFRATLEAAGVTVTQRVQRGADVAAACGQLRAIETPSAVP